MEHATRTVIDYFRQISQIPRCSQQERQISHWLQQWAAARNLEAQSDSAGNLVIRVPATAGFEGAPAVVLQGHMDMVCEKQAGSDHDFSKDPIALVVDGPWLTARETTLGADNGIAIALILALVDQPGRSHPPLELFFTVEEETGLTGALNMDPALLTGRVLINLDSEDEGVFVVGCAGGRTTTLDLDLPAEPLAADDVLVQIAAGGMKGGHSGVDIAKHRANANQVMARLLSAAKSAAPLRLVALTGGTGRNVIPRACEALVGCRREQLDGLTAAVAAAAGIIQAEYRVSDPGLSIRVEEKGSARSGGRGLNADHTARVVDTLLALPAGPVEMDAAFPLLVQTSVNLAMVALEAGRLVVTVNLRSSVPSRLDAVRLALEALGRLAGARVDTNRGYPSWPMKHNSPLVARCRQIYRDLFQADPTVQIMHAGLECGVIGERCPGMDMISLGPTTENPHSPSERLYLPSVEKVWRLLVALLASLGR